MPSIYHYFDYRDFLRDLIEERRKKSSAWSQRALLAKMGITSSGFLANVLARKNHFTPDHVEVFASIANLSPHEADYLYNLLYFAKAKTLSEQNHFYELLLAAQKTSIKQLSPRQLGLFTEWYYVVIRELLNFFPFSGDYKALARMLNPPIPEGKAKKAIATLENLGLIRKSSTGVYEQVERTLSTGDEVQSLQVANFQSSMITFAQKAFDDVQSDERDVTGVTLTLSDASLKKVKEEVGLFRKRLSRIAFEEQSPDRVFRCNVQVFPVTKRKRGG